MNTNTKLYMVLAVDDNDSDNDYSLFVEAHTEKEARELFRIHAENNDFPPLRVHDTCEVPATTGIPHVHEYDN